HRLSSPALISIDVIRRGEPRPLVAAHAALGADLCFGGLMNDVEVRDVPDSRRYEAWVNGHLAGFAEYQKTSELIVFTHTEVNRCYEGQGVGSKLVRRALQDVRDRGTHRVLPLCPFVSAWIGRNPDFTDVVYRAAPSSVPD
ncbi:MAG TPA: GNAT family N-acetyltransferase, partial [Actinomycetales bacterium]|nr:GNAT family N-acetyltransferase [Actinomycetales bacterium]